jgi:hypothetical protein
MQRPKCLMIPVLRNLTIALGSLIVLSTIVLPLAGCSDSGQGGPSISSLSTPTDNQPSENTEADTTSTETAANEQDDPTISMESTEAEPLPNEVAEADLEPPPPTGATAQLNWDASSDPNVQSTTGSDHPENMVHVPTMKANASGLPLPLSAGLNLIQPISSQSALLVNRKVKQKPLVQMRCSWSHPLLKAEEIVRQVITTSALPWILPGERISSLTSTR